MELFVTGLSHRTAPVAVRERLAIVPAELEAHVRRLAAAAGMREAVVVSTCNRTEIYGAFSDAEQAQRSVREVLMEALLAGGPLPDAEDPEMVCARHLYTRERREAVLHLFRVAASLDSLVIGEPQILGQIKEAYDLALRAGAAGPLLGACSARRSGWRARSGGTRASPRPRCRSARWRWIWPARCGADSRGGGC